MYSIAPRRVLFIVTEAFESLQIEIRRVFQDRSTSFSMETCFGLLENRTSYHIEKGKRMAGYLLFSWTSNAI